MHLALLGDGALRLRAVAPDRSGMYDATRIPAIRGWPSQFQALHYILTWMYKGTKGPAPAVSDASAVCDLQVISKAQKTQGQAYRGLGNNQLERKYLSTVFTPSC